MKTDDRSCPLGQNQNLTSSNRARRRPLLAALILISLVSISLLTSADQTNEEKKLTGAWLVAFRSPGSTTTSFFSLVTYFEDGNLIQESTGVTALAAATSRSAGHGKWKRTGHNQFTHTFVYFRFDEERRYIGTRVVTSTMTLSGDGSQYQGDPVAQNFDTDGNLLSTVRGGIDSAQRLF